MTLQRAVRTFDLNDAVHNLTATPIVAFQDTAIENGWVAVAVRDTLTDQPYDPEAFGLGKTIQASTARRNASQRWTILGENCVYLFAVDEVGELWSAVVTVAAETLAQARTLADETLARFPRRTPLPDQTVRVAFWALGKNGPYYKSRKIQTPTWAEIRENYATPTRTALDQAMRLRPPIAGGQLLLFHGEPGVGKTYAIRALMREWKPWAHASYIVDPDRFFSLAEYMMNVTMDAAQELEEDTPDIDPNDVTDGGYTPEEAVRLVEGYESERGYRERGRKRQTKWHLLVVEDADDFVGVDAKTRTGQSLGRLLNIVDGLVGQGLRILVLLTANEQVGRMHPALTRSGRCLANVDFADLSAEEAQAWGERNGIVVPAQRAKLNTLYALTRHPIATVADGAKPGVVP